MASAERETSSAERRPIRWDKLRKRWRKVRTPRDALLRIGKDLRPLIDRTIARSSEVGDPPVFDPRRFPFVRPLEESWETIRDEAAGALARRGELPQVEQISPDHRRIADGGGWKSYFLYGYGHWRERAARRCPETVRLLRDVPGLESAFFSIMEPGQKLRPHRGPTKAILTWHLPLFVPARADACWIRIAGDKHVWQEGRSLIFDDTFRHSVENATDEPRVVLLMHVRRPVRFPGSWVSRGFLGAIRRSPFVRDGVRNQDAWEATFEAGPGGRTSA